MNRNFSQTITVRCDDAAKLVELLTSWDLSQATSDVMGYMGTRLLADRENPGQYVVVADFGVVRRPREWPQLHGSGEGDQCRRVDSDC